ncbi:MAG: GtrA family protein [Patescibacteria group bacterium]
MSAKILEIKKVIRFIIIGGITFILQSFLYLLFSRLLFTDINNTASYCLAVSYAVIFNFLGHRLWTFQDQKSDNKSPLRYALIVAVGFILSALLFWIGHALLKVYDLLVVVLTGFSVPIVTYLGHRFYTFKNQQAPSPKPQDSRP